MTLSKASNNQRANGEPGKLSSYYTRPGAEGYRVNKDATWGDAANRRLRVITVGAGLSGILMAYRLQADCANIEHSVYEKNHDIGGTWLENRFAIRPSVACMIAANKLPADIPVALATFPPTPMLSHSH